MTVEPDIVKMLREEEKPRKLGGKSQSVYEALKITEEPSDDIPDEIIESIENTGKAGDDRIYSKKYDKSIEAVLKIIQFTEKVATKIHGVTDEGEIYRLVMEEFKKSKEYSANIFLLTDDDSKEVGGWFGEDYIEKPYDAGDLKKRVDKVLNEEG